MNAAEVVATEVDWVSIRKSLFTEDGNENAGVLLAGKAGPSERERLLVPKVSACACECLCLPR